MKRKNTQQRRTNEAINLAFAAIEHDWSRDYTKAEATRRALTRNPDVLEKSLATTVSESLLCYELRHDLAGIIESIDDPALSDTRFHHKLMDELRRLKQQGKMLDYLLKD